MKKYDLVKLINVSPYLRYNINKDAYGVVLNDNSNILDVMFFNPQNIGEFVVVKVDVFDVSLAEESLPEAIRLELDKNIEETLKKARRKLEPVLFENYDFVELLSEEEKYTKFGVHKGARGYVVENKAIQNHILVDFSYVTQDGEYMGDCISVKIDDLKKL